MKRGAFLSVGLAAAVALTAPAIAQETPTTEDNASTHSAGWPGLGSGSTPQEVQQSLEQGPQLNRNLSALDLVDQRRRLDAALHALAPQRAGQVDAYVVSIALDSDPVFAREARQVGEVLKHRYNAQGRTLVLAGPDGGDDGLPRGSIRSLLIALANLAERMDPAEDVLVLYSTSHGLPQGLAYHYEDDGYGVLSPKLLADTFAELGIEKRLLLISACYSGVFVPAMASDDTAIITASADNRTSFGCQPDNDWTFFGDALVNRAMRKPLPLLMAHAEATRSIADWESRMRLPASLPQARIGNAAMSWLSAIEANLPQVATAPVGKPAMGE
ncbi:MAG: peptidase C13 [Altererythrobacter sp.]|nr:peptidase C13 [Altererythrobacter sp.]